MNRLGDVVDIQMGIILKRIEAKEGKENKGAKEGTGYKVLMPKAIENGLVAEDNLDDILVAEGAKRLKVTKEGDIVLKLTPPYDAAYVTQDGLLVPSYCVLISTKAGSDVQIDTRFLAGYLNTTLVKHLLEQGLNGAYGMVKVKDLSELDLPFPAYEEQVILGETYLLMCQKRAKLRELMEVENKISDNLITEAVLEVKRNE